MTITFRSGTDLKGMDNANTYIDVAVSLPAWKTYTYAVPGDMADLVAVGKRVLVPFQNRRVTGYILSGDHTPPEDPAIQVKHVLDILDDSPLFHRSHIPFFLWISTYYMFPIGEVIKSALPGGITVQDTVHVGITAAGEEALSQNRLNPLDHKVLTLLGQGEKTAATLIRSCDPPIPQSVISRLARKNLVTLTRVLNKAHAGHKFETFVRPLDHESPCGHFSAKRKELLDEIRKTGDVALGELKKTFPSAAAQIRFLEQEGQVACFQKKIYRDPFGEDIPPDQPPQLTDEQATIVSQVGEKIGKGFESFLLAGVTGSGKTEVYLRLVEKAFEQGLSALVLVPEIALISQTERRFRMRFGDNIAVLHSTLTKGEKFDQWMRIAEKKVTLVIGARSAIFAPLENLGLVIVDEEHDGSYKQENGLKYNARDLAVLRAKLADAVCLLGSATPSIQSYFNTVTGKFSELRLTKRVSERPMPEIRIVDLKTYRDLPGIHSIITPPLAEAMGRTLANKEQVLLFLNRRGYANYPVCATCGEPMKCVSCDVSLTLHQAKNAYRCHMCNYMIPSNSKCRVCNSSHIKHLGFGTEKIEDAVKAMFPEATVSRMDQDTTTRKGSLVRLLKDLKDRKTDILVGTQMIAKGHDFPGITLVGVICADQSLNFPDFRACERTFQLLAQVAGRAGRGDQPGKVIMQTYNPDHFSISAAEQQDFYSFYEKEIAFRESLGYPPYSRMVQIRLSGKDRRAVQELAESTGMFIHERIMESRTDFEHLEILGPIEAPIPKLADRYRWQILLKSVRQRPLQKMAGMIVNASFSNLKKDGVRITLDIDPYYLM